MIKQLALKGKYQELKEIISTLSNKDLEIMARFFSILPQLINISEDVDLAYEINYKNNTDSLYLGKLSKTISDISKANNPKEILENINIMPVLTAHQLKFKEKVC